MNPEAEETAKIILAEVARAKGWSEPRNPHDLFLSAETIISALAYLVGPTMAAEQTHRRKVQTYIDRGMSVSGAEAKAKSEDEYYTWKKLERACELGQEQIMLLKKFGILMDGEQRRS